MKEKIKDIYFRIFGNFKRRKFENTDFTIISNNCFGGIIYRNHHLPYLSPTCGLFFMADDYIKFIYDIKKYLSYELREISIDDSKYKDYLKQNKYNGVIGKLDNIEIMFLHYKSFEEAKEKWIRRSKRINYDKIIYKFNDQNECTIEHLKKFEKFPAKNKICFTAVKHKGINSIVLDKFKDEGYVLDDTKEKNYKGKFNIYNYINSLEKKDK